MKKQLARRAELVQQLSQKLSLSLDDSQLQLQTFKKLVAAQELENAALLQQLADCRYNLSDPFERELSQNRKSEQLKALVHRERVALEKQMDAKLKKRTDFATLEKQMAQKIYALQQKQKELQQQIKTQQDNKRQVIEAKKQMLAQEKLRETNTRATTQRIVLQISGLLGILAEVEDCILMSDHRFSVIKPPPRSDIYANRVEIQRIATNDDDSSDVLVTI